jgi:hypothetical protein
MRFATAASLIAVGILIGIGGVALLPSAGERPLVAIADGSSRPAMPWMPGRAPATAAGRPSTANKAPEPVTEGVSTSPGTQVLPERQAFPERQVSPEHQVSAARESVRQQTAKQDALAQDAVPLNAVPQSFVPQSFVPQASVQQAPVQQTPTQQSSLTTPAQEPPVHAAPARRPAAAQPPAPNERHAAKPTVDAQTPPPARKKIARRDRTTKPPTGEALNAVRTFGDNLHDIPVSSYAADGTPRKIVIRPTSIQDVYYYSAPR